MCPTSHPVPTLDVQQGGLHILLWPFSFLQLGWQWMQASQPASVCVAGLLSPAQLSPWQPAELGPSTEDINRISPGLHWESCRAAGLRDECVPS